jgi:hypothetical protein
MTALVVVNMAILLIVVLFGLSLLMLFRDRGLLHNRAESAALKSAVYLNVNDRAEQMNNMVARSRELVFNSRQSAEAATERHQYLQPLASHLLMLAREGAVKVLDEKKRLVRKTIGELKAQSKSISSGGNGLSLPHTEEMRVVDLEVGSMNDQTTNIAALPGNSALFSYDLAAKHICSGNNLYYPSLDLKLPGPDSDLRFTLSPMPRCRQGQAEAARLIAERDFKRYCYLIKDGAETGSECEEFPSAQKISISQKAKTLNGNQQEIVTGAAASTNCLGTVP